MQWNDGVNAGFNSKTNVTWLPVHPDYKHVNVEVQQNSANVSTTTFFNHPNPCFSICRRSRRQMKVLFWLSTASSAFCGSRSSPCTAAGSATSMPTLTSSRT